MLLLSISMRSVPEKAFFGPEALVRNIMLYNLGLSAKKIMLPGKPPACLGNVIKRMHTPKKEKRTLSQPVGTLSPNSISHPFSPFPQNLDFHVSLCLSCSSVSW